MTLLCPWLHTAVIFVIDHNTHSNATVINTIQDLILLHTDTLQPQNNELVRTSVSSIVEGVSLCR